MDRVGASGLGELGDTTGVAHRLTFDEELATVDPTPDREVASNTSTDRCEHLDEEPGAVLERAPVLVDAEVGRR